jgi:hypothetical protein
MRHQKTEWLAVSTAGLLIIGSWEQAIPKSRAPEENARPEVRVVQGKVLGTLVEGGLAFKNLPYAAPPVGPNRWRILDRFVRAGRLTINASGQPARS